MLTSIALILLNIVVGTVGQVMLKAGTTQVGRIESEDMLRPVEALRKSPHSNGWALA